MSSSIHIKCFVQNYYCGRWKLKTFVQTSTKQFCWQIVSGQLSFIYNIKMRVLFPRTKVWFQRLLYYILHGNSHYYRPNKVLFSESFQFKCRTSFLLDVQIYASYQVDQVVEILPMLQGWPAGIKKTFTKNGEKGHKMFQGILFISAST